MPLPRLLHPVNIQIQQWIPGETMFDDEAREAIKQVKLAPLVICPGQVSWNTKDEVVLDAVGSKLVANGYILFRYVDLKARNITLNVQDNIKKIGWQTVNLFIISDKPCGHYADQDGASLVKAYFSGRHPSRGPN